MIGRFADWFDSRRWFIRYLLYAEWVILVTLVALITARSFWQARSPPYENWRMRRPAFKALAPVSSLSPCYQRGRRQSR
jgi:hypothetical protein